MDALLEEMDAGMFAEWIAFDSLEPIDAAGAILGGLSGPEQPAPTQKAQTWEDQFALMSKFAGRPHGRT